MSNLGDELRRIRKLQTFAEQFYRRRYQIETQGYYDGDVDWVIEGFLSFFESEFGGSDPFDSDE